MKRPVFTLVLLSIFLYAAQGIRFEKSSVSPNIHQELIIETSSRNGDDGSTMPLMRSAGLEKKLNTKMISSTSITIKVGLISCK
ncbi:hypothetical protein L1887_38372 [Cichorium endivia]|nr:hypothetical protein L1887_38372 [Cichorium endivia]